MHDRRVAANGKRLHPHLNKVIRNMNTNPFLHIHDDCPPESPWQLYLNAALVAVGKAHGAFVNDLSEEVSQLVINAVVTAAYAALEAAHVADEWSAVAKPTAAHRPPPVWPDNVIIGPISIYQAMAWAYQAEAYPKLFNDAYNEAYQADLVETIDAMLKFALTAAGADGAWDRLYSETLKRMQVQR